MCRKQLSAGTVAAAGAHLVVTRNKALVVVDRLAARTLVVGLFFFFWCLLI